MAGNRMVRLRNLEGAAMRIIVEQMLNLGDAGERAVTIVGQVRSSGLNIDCMVYEVMVYEVTVTAPGSPGIDLWPLLKGNPIAYDIEAWLSEKFCGHCQSVAASIKDMEYRDRMQHRMECDA